MKCGRLALLRNWPRVLCVGSGVRFKAWSRGWLALLSLCLAAGCAAGTGPAARTAAGSSPAAGAGRSQIVSYRGVHVRVPASWPVVDGMHTAFCGSPFPAAATAFTGPNLNGPPGCPMPRPGPPRDGVWLAPGSPPPGARPVTIRPGIVVREQRHSTRDHIRYLWYHRVQVEIGIGADPRTAAAIVRSAGYTAGEPDSRAAGTCARSHHAGSMPRPRRLARRLVLDHGDVTLNPLRPGDRAVMSAAQAWRDAVPGSPFVRYRLLLVRYSAKFPARPGADGTLVPEDRHILAWVIYGEPRTPIPGCGGWSLAAFNASTSRGIAVNGW